MLAQAAPNIGPMVRGRPSPPPPPPIGYSKLKTMQFWEAIRGSDGIVRHLQWQSRVEGSTNSKKDRLCFSLASPYTNW